MTSSTTRRRPLGFGQVLLACIGLGLACGAIVAVASALNGGDQPALLGLGVLAVGVVAMVLSVRWWRDADEAVREAHKFSWYWGGSGALVLIGAAAVFLWGVAQGDPAGRYGLTAREAGLVLVGIAGSVGLLLAGYGLCWAGWWLKHSR